MNSLIIMLIAVVLVATTLGLLIAMVKVSDWWHDEEDY
jgi:hypothetical protein